MATFISKGTYGCTYAPPQPCIGESKNTPSPRTQGTEGKIGKVYFNDKDATIEKDIAVLLNKIDPKSEFMIFPGIRNETMCKVPLNNIEDGKCLDKPEKNASSKKASSKKASSKKASFKYQLFMEYGGRTLHKYVVSDELSRKEFLIVLLPIFKAVQLLIRNDLVHQDIKDNNIVVDDSGERARLIDFGGMKHVNDLYNSETNKWFRPSYFLQGPEHRLIYEDPVQLQKDLVEKKYKDIAVLDGYGTLNVPIFDETYYNQLTGLVTRYNKLSSIEDVLDQMKSEKVHTKMDLYSLGILMMRLQPSLVVVPLEDTRYLNKEHADIVIYRFNNLIKGLLQPDPQYRPDIDNVVKEIEDIIVFKKRTGPKFITDFISHKAPSSRAPSSRAPSSRAPSSRAPSSRAPSSRAPTVSTASRAPTVSTASRASAASRASTARASTVPTASHASTARASTVPTASHASRASRAKHLQGTPESSKKKPPASQKPAAAPVNDWKIWSPSPKAPKKKPPSKAASPKPVAAPGNDWKIWGPSPKNRGKTPS